MSTNLVIGDMIMENDEFKVMTDTGLVTMSVSAPSVLTDTLTYNTASGNTITLGTMFDVDDFLDEHIMNRITVDHKVQEQELMKLKEHAPDYANEIKENIAKNLARDISKKVTYTKKHDKDADVHHFIGRVWCFTEQELKELLQEARNV